MILGKGGAVWRWSLGAWGWLVLVMPSVSEGSPLVGFGHCFFSFVSFHKWFEDGDDFALLASRHA